MLEKCYIYRIVELTSASGYMSTMDLLSQIKYASFVQAKVRIFAFSQRHRELLVYSAERISTKRRDPDLFGAQLRIMTL